MPKSVESKGDTEQIKGALLNGVGWVSMSKPAMFLSVG
jgi:hypothetical protein